MSEIKIISPVYADPGFAALRLNAYINYLYKIHNTYKLPVKSINISPEYYKILTDLLIETRDYFNQSHYSFSAYLDPEEITIFENRTDTRFHIRSK